jgi:hypothetical protein
MEPSDVEELLGRVAEGSLSPAAAADALRRLPFGDLGSARLDHHRHLRQGIPEAIYGPGKSAEEVGLITAALLEAGSGPVVLTRADEASASAVEAACRAASVVAARHGAEDIWTLTARAAHARGRRILVVTAGTADGPVAEECAGVLGAMGLAPVLLRDRGVAGIHRLLDDLDLLLEAEGTVVVAGMEGALASVVGGIVRGPVVAVPTSTGYGAGLEGVTALLSMMASCAAGVSVVGIDNGFGAAMVLARALEDAR